MYQFDALIFCFILIKIYQSKLRLLSALLVYTIQKASNQELEDA